MNTRNCLQCWCGKDGVEHYCPRHSRLHADAIARARCFNSIQWRVGSEEALSGLTVGDYGPDFALHWSMAVELGRVTGFEPLVVNVRAASTEARAFWKMKALIYGEKRPRALDPLEILTVICLVTTVKG
ncbi:MAG: hypothetical protein ACRD3L_10890 [Terriglobales bacterium]